MAYIELVIEVAQHQAGRLSDSLVDAGALSASIEDADAGSADEQALFGEPGGEPPDTAWQRSVIVALFDKDDDIDAHYAQACQLAGISPAPVSFRRSVAEQDWVRQTQNQFKPMHIGARLWVVPSWHNPHVVAREHRDGVVVELDPGLAFGTGSHPTTRLCLGWLERHIQGGESVIDYGCGSGILAIAAKKLGAGKVYGTDIDPHAISASTDNARVNQTDISFLLPDAFAANAADVVVANILSNPLKVLAPLLCELVKPGGHLVLSGILERQWREVAAIYAPMVEMSVWRAEDGWVCLAGRKFLAHTEPSESSITASPTDALAPNAPSEAAVEIGATCCPTCETIFAIEPDKLAMRAGRVRCGLCGTAFNAILQAVARPPDESHSEAPQDYTPPAEPALPVAATAEQIAPPGTAAAATFVTERPPALPTGVPGTYSEAGFLKPQRRRHSSPRKRMGWIIASVIAALLLLSQAALIWRNDLAAYWAPARPVLQEACRHLGCRVELPARIGYLSIASAELRSEPQMRDRYIYTALLQNQAPTAQQFPAIDLALLDARGNTVIRRVIRPEEYTSGESVTRNLAAGIAAQGEVTVRIQFDAPGESATDFRSVIFYP